MTGHIYRDVILEQHVRLSRGAMGAEFLFMEDNARPHRANIVDEGFQSEDITHMDWPAYSPHLNPIEHVKNRWNAGILSITNRSVSNSECGPACDRKTVAEVSKNGGCYPTNSISQPRVTTPLQDRYLVKSARRQRGSTDRALGSALTVATALRISRQTVYRRLNHAGMYARRPAVCIPLTSAHQHARLNWSLKHQHWSVTEWAQCDVH
ncbi:transposable element Tcb2 transposase [Trichonephila clavipes]|nr:transposable element Tcb2 transposase [Trichonephila clavipes]